MPNTAIAKQIRPKPIRRIAQALGALLLAGALSGCLVSDELVELGPRAQPLTSGLFVSFTEDGAPEEAAVVTVTGQGVYSHEDFVLTLFESGLGDDLFFAAYEDRDQGGVMYGLAQAQDGVLAYPMVMCDMVPEAVKAEAKLEPGEDGCVIQTPEQGRAVLTALAAEMKPNKDWLRFVRQDALRR